MEGTVFVATTIRDDLRRPPGNSNAGKLELSHPPVLGVTENIRAVLEEMD